MDHPDPHPLAGQTVFVSLKAKDRTGRLYSGMEVEIFDWMDRYVGTALDALVVASNRETDGYLRRMATTADPQWATDVDIVAVTPVGQKIMMLVNDAEIRAPKREPESGD